MLRRIPELDSKAPVFIASIYAVFPVNAARIAHIDLQYAASVAVFFLAWYLIAIDLDKPSLLRRVFVAPLLALAMLTMKSLMLYSVLMPLYCMWLERGAIHIPRVSMRLLRRYGFLLALPLVTWVIHITALRPSGLYVGYNAITMESLLGGVSAMPGSTWESLLRPILVTLPVVIPAIIATFFFRTQGKRCAAGIRRSLLMIAVGVFAYLLAVLPYLSVGKVPQTAGPDWWDSRHQVLVPLGAALVVYGLVTLAGNAFRLRQFTVATALVAFIAVFAVADARTSLEYQVDWYKQVSLMKHMESSEDIRRGNTFIVRDNALDLNVVGRRYLPYELGGMTHTVYGDATRFAVDEVLSPLGYADQLTYYRSYEQYHWTGWQPPPRRYLIEIERGTKDITDTRQLLGLMWRDLFAPDDFDRIVKRALVVRTSPLPYDG